MTPPPVQQQSEADPGWSTSGAFVGCFLALLAAATLYSVSSTDTLRFPDRAIGVGLLSGVDPSRRFVIYLQLVGLSLGVWLACFYCGRYLSRRFQSASRGVQARLESALCITLVALGSVVVVGRVGADRLDDQYFVALGALAVVATLALVRRLVAQRVSSRFLRRLTSWSTLAPLLLLPWPLVQVAAASRARTGVVLIGAVALACAVALSYRFGARGRARSSRLRQGLLSATAPLFLFPLLCPVANELQYTLARQRVFDPRDVALVFLGVLALAASVLFWLVQRGHFRFAPGRLVSYWCFPLIVFGSTLLAVHQHELGGGLDELHDGEQIAAVQQLLQFDRWPFVDIWPAHGLFDYVGALYAHANGLRHLEIKAWDGIIAAFSATASYAVLAAVSTPWFAFALAMLLPIEALLPLPQYSFFYAEPSLLAIGLMSWWALKRPSLLRHACVSGAAFVSFFWTPTSGVAAIASVFGLLVLQLFTARDRQLARRALAVSALTGAGVFLAYLLVLLACRRSVPEVLGLVRSFIQAETMIGGYPAVIYSFEALAFFQYVALPGIGLVYLAKLARHALERRPLGRADHLLAFLTLASFVLFARTLSRHGLVERYQPFYFPFVAIALLMPRRWGPTRESPARGAETSVPSPWVTAVRKSRLALVWCCTALAAYLVAFPVERGKPPGLRPFAFHDWTPDAVRFVGKRRSYDQVGAFFQANLRPGETFLELLNAPVLYALLEREVPDVFFLPTMFYATDATQNRYLARLEAFGGQERVPFALLPGTGRRGEYDDIPTLLRSYRISEYLYRRYAPVGVIDGFELWASRQRWEEANQSVAPLPLSLRPVNAARPSSLAPLRREGDALWLEPNGRDPRVEGAVEVKGVSLGGLASHRALRFQYRASAGGTLEVFLRLGRKYNIAYSGRAAVQPGPGAEWQRGEVPLTVPVARRTLKDLRIDPPDRGTFEIRALELVSGLPPAATPEHFALGMLPFIWGNFDARLERETPPVLRDLSPPEPQALDLLELHLPEDVDKSSGNYLSLCIKLPGAGTEPRPGLRRWRQIHHTSSWQAAGKLTLHYGAAPASSFELDLVRPETHTPGLPAALVRSFDQECKQYFVRLSAQYSWSSQAVTKIRLQATVPAVLETAHLLKGD